MNTPWPHIIAVGGVLYLMEYVVSLDGHTAGKARVEKQGLFYCITCLCRFPSDELYNIHLSSNDAIADLGLCASNKELKTRIPVKRIGEGALNFRAVRRREDLQYYAVSENALFPYLSKLPQARLRQKKGTIYLMITSDPL